MRMNKATLRLILVFSAYIIFTGMLQVTLPSSFAIWGAKPDLLLVLAVLSGYMFGQRDGIIVGLAAGFFRDIMAGRALGLGMLLLMYSALFASFAFRRFFRRNFLMGLAQVAMVTVLYQFVDPGPPPGQPGGPGPGPGRPSPPGPAAGGGRLVGPAPAPGAGPRRGLRRAPAPGRRGAGPPRALL